MNLKKISAVFAAMAVASLSAVIPAFAEETEETTEATTVITQDAVSEDGEWTYTVIKDNTTGEEYASLEGYSGSDTEIVIPSEIDGNIVRELGQYTFYENPSITEITISDTITAFGDFPFFACS
jgi:hypothetical protein